MKKRKIDQIRATAKMMMALTNEKGFVNISKNSMRDRVELHLLEEEFLKRFPKHNTNENWSENSRELYVDYPSVRIFALQEKEDK